MQFLSEIQFLRNFLKMLWAETVKQSWYVFTRPLLGLQCKPLKFSCSSHIHSHILKSYILLEICVVENLVLIF